MTHDEKETLYAEFRERLLSEMAARLLKENLPLAAIGRAFFRWKTELALAAVMKEMHATDSNASSERGAGILFDRGTK